MMAQVQSELENKEEALENLQATIQEHREARPPYIATTSANTMTKTTLVSSPYIDIP